MTFLTHSLRLLSILAVALVTSGLTAAADEKRPPNILYIMTDDHAAHAIGAYGGRFADLDPTPTIDRLAAEGMRFTNAFCINSICTPSRATILTGQYCHVHGNRAFAPGLGREHQHLPRLIKEAGYETAVVGKWHLLQEPEVFDYYCVLPGQGSYFNPIFRVRGPDPWPENTIRVAGYDSVHSSDAITDIALRWLRNRQQKDKPFFLLYHFKAPHDNFENAERYDWLFECQEMPEPDSLWERGNHGPAGRPRYGTSIGRRNERRNMGHHMFVDPDLDDQEYQRVAYQRYMKKYFRCVRGVDDNIARVLDYLEKSGELDRTAIVYTSDQGFMLGEHDYIDKRWMYEESMRMPLIVRWPGVVEPGSTCAAIVNNVDFAPTLLTMASAEVPEFMQGRSFLPLLRGEPEPDDWPKATYYRYWLHMTHHDVPAHYGIRTHDFKLIFFYGLPLDVRNALAEPTEPYWELYDLRHDPREMNNVYTDPSYAQVATELKEQLLHLKARIGDNDEQYPDLMEVRREHWD